MGLSCHYNQVDVHEDASALLRPIQIALTSSLTYQVQEFLALEAGFNYQSSNTFATPNTEGALFQSAVFRPMNVQLGVQVILD